jgi:hypothetical protein
MKTKPNHLWIDQYGQHVWARTLKELRLKCGGGRIGKVYRDDPLTKRTTHCGYFVGSRWFSRYAPVERAL